MENTFTRPLPVLTRVNRLLIILILGLNLYVGLMPFWPQISLRLHRRATQAVGGLPYKTNLDTNSSASASRKAIPADNRLVIPKLALNEHIYQGSSPYLVNKGVWVRPKTSTPPDGSNTVMVAHRFTYDGPATFYNLDKLAIGDFIVVYWQGKEYDYKIDVTKVVPPTALEIEDPSKNSELTLYTCTPIWSAKNRLVVIASLMPAAELPSE